jgi:hypothetical protein
VNNAVPRLARTISAVTAAVALAACGSGSSGPPPNSGCDPTIEFCGNIPLSTDACSEDQYWPFRMHSGQRPFTVHYSRLADETRASEIVAVLENAWTVQVDQLGFTPPLDDGGNCGDDGRFDVFIWRNVDGAFVDTVADNPVTPYDDYATYMAIDAFGPYGGELLDTTLAHEFNHALQASDDWWESAFIYEMSATFVEALVYPDQDDYYYTIEDFQNHPEWSLFHDDNYRTWYMYGAAMYLHFLRERHFPQDPRRKILRLYHSVSIAIIYKAYLFLRSGINSAAISASTAITKKY